MTSGKTAVSNTRRSIIERFSTGRADWREQRITLRRDCPAPQTRAGGREPINRLGPTSAVLAVTRVEVATAVDPSVMWGVTVAGMIYSFVGDRGLARRLMQLSTHDIPTESSVSSLFRLFGDVNGDRTVNITDLTAFRNAFGATTTDANYQPFLDFNGDGVINLTDLTQFRKRFGIILP